jgi:uncharacterized protein YdhG (YjbR/CyaY superfamily)
MDEQPDGHDVKHRTQPFLGIDERLLGQHSCAVPVVVGLEEVEIVHWNPAASAALRTQCSLASKGTVVPGQALDCIGPFATPERVMPSSRSDQVNRYIAGFPPDAAFILEQLRETVHKAAPGTLEDFKYDMPLFRHGERYIFYMGGWKKHVGLYPIYPQAAALEEQLAPLRSGKDTLKLVYAKPIPYPLVAKLVKAIVKANNAKS